MSCWKSVHIVLSDASDRYLHYYTELTVSNDDKVLFDTKNGVNVGTVQSVLIIPCNPFKKNPCGYRAKAHILQNLTTGEVNKIYKEKLEELEMFENAAIVKYIDNNNKSVSYLCMTAVEVKVGDVVVYTDTTREISKISFDAVGIEGATKMHVGVVTQLKTAEECANLSRNAMIIGKVDVEPFKTVRDNIREKAQIKKQLDKKVAAFKECEMYAIMAASDPEVEALLTKYKSL